MQGTNSGESSPIAESQETGKLKITEKNYQVYRHEKSDQFHSNIWQ